jgi:hypothetical protein
MRKTSRRTFGKQLTGAIAALPLASLANRAAGQAKQPTKSATDGKRYHQNTPPPLVIEDGSLSFSIKADKELKETPDGDNFIYTGEISSGRNNFHHIRVLHGSGKLLYEDLEAKDSIITLDLQEVSAKPIGTIRLEAFASEIKVTSKPLTSGKAKLKYDGVTGMTAKKQRYHHEGSGPNDFRISTITIMRGEDQSSQTFTAPAEASDRPFWQEYRILVWFS